MAEQTQAQSTQRSQRQALVQTTWDQLEQAGAYVEFGTGDLYRVPSEALIRGGSPIIARVSNGATRLLRVSDDPMVPIQHAREVAANNNLQPNF